MKPKKNIKIIMKKNYFKKFVKIILHWPNLNIVENIQKNLM